MLVSRCSEAAASAEKEIRVSGDDSSEQNAEKVEYTTATVPQEEEQEEKAPPEEGLVAWLQVLGSFALYFNTWGMINTFGVFQTYYAADLLSHKSQSAISWIGSTQSFFLLVVGVVSGPLYDAGHLRLLLGTGASLTALGLMLTSIATEYWQVVLAQAVCVGIGAGCLYVPSLAIIPQWFLRRKALALGLVTSGSSFGGVVYSLLFQGLQPRVGFGWAARVMGFVSLATLAVPLAVLRKRRHIHPPITSHVIAAALTTTTTTETIATTAAAAAAPAAAVVASSPGGGSSGAGGGSSSSSSSSRNVRSLLDLDAFRERPYVLYCAAMALSMLAFFAPVFYLQSYALSHGLDGRPALALHLIAILNAASVPGRIAPSFVAGRIGPAHALFLSALLTGVSVLSWIGTGAGAGTGNGNVAFAAAFGFFSGGIVALPAVVLTSFTRDLSRIGTRLGMSSVFNAVGSLVGAPIAGAIMRATGSYLGIQLFAGFLFVATALLVLALRFVITGRKLFVKA
ncbi:hypothetical protein SLS62_001162 [Diatrype stigma]|uniref:Major facilitator superfamily (MFS) profile domain-containing protein n=1 Tax=Diatrype stigma TaxID=117547 RepID=A0AAN9V075_9PEZI